MGEMDERGQKVKIKYYCFPHLKKKKSKARKTLSRKKLPEVIDMFAA